MLSFVKRLSGVLLVLLCAPTFANACQIGWRSATELIAEAKAIVVARIVAVRHASSSQQSEKYEYEIFIEKSELGKIQTGKGKVTFEDLKAHVRGGERVCPVKNGSGIEHELHTNRRYKLFLDSAADLQILLAKEENN